MKKIITTCLAFCIAFSVASAAHASNYTLVFVKYKNYQIPIKVWDNTPPDTPTNFAGYQTSNNSAQISWDRMQGAFYHILEWYNPDLLGWQTAYYGALSEYNVDGFLLGQNKLRIRACRDDNTGLALCSVESDTLIVTLTASGSITFSSEPSEFQNPDEDTSAAVAGNSYTATCLIANPPNGACPEDHIDSDDDGTADVNDPYPLQNTTQCTP